MEFIFVGFAIMWVYICIKLYKNDCYGEDKMVDAKDHKTVWPIYDTMTKKQLRQIPPDTPIVFVGDWDKKRMNDVREIIKNNKKM